MGEGRRVLGAFGVEAALEEVGDLLKREWFTLIAGGNRIALDGPQPFCGIDRDQPLLRSEVENVAEGSEIALLGGCREPGPTLLFRSRNGLIDGQIAV